MRYAQRCQRPSGQHRNVFNLVVLQVQGGQLLVVAQVPERLKRSQLIVATEQGVQVWAAT